MRQNKFKKIGKQEQDELFSNFLIDSWSYSKVTTFARNEKAFEMQYVYKMPYKKSATAVAGSAYHYALEQYFLNLKEDRPLPDVADMEILAFNYIDEVPANDWKLQKTTPTVEKSVQQANKKALQGVKNFLQEVEGYTKNIKKVLAVEEYYDDFIVVNGVDIPLPCHAMVDLVFEDNDGKTIVVDHKLKQSFTDEKDATFTFGVQAIIYAIIFESVRRKKVDEVWFVENKVSKNRDGSAQLNFHKITIDEDTRRLYEAILYEPLSSLMMALNNPDHVYILNSNDKFVDMAELYKFWIKTMTGEIEDFNIDESKEELIKKRLKKVKDSSLTNITPRVIKDFEKNTEKFIAYNLQDKNMSNGEKIETVLRSFGVIAKAEHELTGYSFDTILLKVSAGVPVSKIKKHRLDIANALNVPNVRVSETLVMYQGTSYLAIEKTKKNEGTVHWDREFLKGYQIPLGLDNMNETIVWDLDNNSTPHALVCGATGSGKSVLLKSTIEYAKAAGITNIVVLDPKYEFVGMKGVEVLNDIEDIETRMGLLVLDMQERVKSGNRDKTLIIFDEFADALSSARSGKQLERKEQVQVGMYANGMPKMKSEVVEVEKSLEENLRILTQKGRSLGFRIMAATQRASTKIITGDTKVNFPVQICFRVPKEVDSKVVLDESGAESLSGKGDGLMRSPEYDGTKRFQGFFYGA